MKRRLLAGGLGLSLALLAGRAAADRPRPVVASSGPPAAVLLPPRPVTLGRPVALPDPGVRQTSFGGSESLLPAPIIRAQSPDPGHVVPPPPPPPPPGVAVPPLTPPERYNSGVVLDPPPGGGKGFWGSMPDWANPGTWGGGGTGHRAMFQSDHCFDQFISPVSNPFLFEDPRALTEFRPIFIWQQTPSNNYIYRGGDVTFAGMQGRVAFTDRISLVVNKLGWIWNEPHYPGPFPNQPFNPHVGFAELMLGPKFTIIRSEDCGTLLASGLTFDIPVGPKKVFQDTGELSLIPYISVGQNFLRSSYGSFNVLNTTGYSFSVNSVRTDYLYSSLHLDFDVLNAHKFYPLLELNYTNFTRAGTATRTGFEGRDLFNFGSHGVSGNNNLSLAAGARYKFNECIQTGLAAEIPLTGRRDLLDFRLTVDLIFRY